jgi:chromate transport protein ChrA
MESMMTRPPPTELLRYFLYLGRLGFGGPVALVGYMQRDLVERRHWFTKEEYMDREDRGGYQAEWPRL